MAYRLIYTRIDEGQFERKAGFRLQPIIDLALEERGQYDDAIVYLDGEAAWSERMGYRWSEYGEDRWL